MLIGPASSKWFVCFAGIGLLIVSTAGCDRVPRIKQPAMNAAHVAKAALAMYDSNGDGKISGDELNKCPPLKAGRRDLDPKGEGITAKTIEDLVTHWKETKIGRVPFKCSVTHNKKPLADAIVKFVPEAFLGTDFQAAFGKTDAKGIADVSIPNVTPTGLALGFYRVEITKDGETIPPKFNAETMLGVSLTHAFSGFGAGFDLTY
jgi:hypothetical protein